MDCLFCRILRGDEPAHIIADDGDVAILLALRPIVQGHLLVVPRRHVETIGDLSPALLLHTFQVVQSLQRALPEATGAPGLLLVMNNTVGQSIPHAHVHLLPRFENDALSRTDWPRHTPPPDEPARLTTRIQAALTGLFGGSGGEVQKQ